MRGDIFELPKPKDAMGHEQTGQRYCVVVQSDDLPLSTLLVCPTSRSAASASWRPEITIKDERTRVLTEQVAAVDPQRLGKKVGAVGFADMLAIEAGLKTVLAFLT